MLSVDYGIVNRDVLVSVHVNGIMCFAKTHTLILHIYAYVSPRAEVVWLGDAAIASNFDESIASDSNQPL